MITTLALLLVGAARADDADRLPVVGQVWETTAGSVLSTGHGVERQVTAPDGPTYYERGWVATFPAEWAASPSNPHGGYQDVPAGALVECIAVDLSPEPYRIVTVVWYGRSPADLDGVLFRETYAVERSPSSTAVVDVARLALHPAAFDAKAWRRLANRHGRDALTEWVERP